MSYQGNRTVAWIDRVTKKLTQTPDGADRLSRWLVAGFTLLMLSVACMGLSMAVADSDRGSAIAFIGMIGGLFVRLSFVPHIHFVAGADERERLIAWKSIAISGGIVALLLVGWMMANGASEDYRVWVPQSQDQWRALAFAALASLNSLAVIAIVWMQPPYLPEPDEEFSV